MESRVLGDDPFEVDADRISKVPVVETWMGGVRQA
jgi:predicted amidohydrolase YtcJ